MRCCYCMQSVAFANKGFASTLGAFAYMDIKRRGGVRDLDETPPTISKKKSTLRAQRTATFPVSHEVRCALLRVVQEFHTGAIGCRRVAFQSQRREHVEYYVSQSQALFSSSSFTPNGTEDDNMCAASVSNIWACVVAYGVLDYCLHFVKGYTI